MSALANALLGAGLGQSGYGLAGLGNLFLDPGGFVGGDFGGFNTYSGATEGEGLRIAPDTGITPVGNTQLDDGLTYEPGLEVETPPYTGDISTGIDLLDTTTGLPIIGGTNIETGSTTPIGGGIDLSELFAGIGGGFNPNISQAIGGLNFGAISGNAGPGAANISTSGLFRPRELPRYISKALGGGDILSTSLLG